MEHLIHKIQALNLFTILFCQPEKDLTHSKELFDLFAEYLKPLSEKASAHASKLYENYITDDNQKLLIDYTTIFMGLSGAIAYPYSSVYFGEKSLMNATTEWVLKFYNDTGIRYDEELQDMPDNIVVELEFLYYLNFNLAKALDEGDSETAKNMFDREVRFYREHFAIWVPKFCNSITDEPINPFYTELANCLNHFIKDYKFFSPNN